MSKALYKCGGLRFWNENEIQLGEAFVGRATTVLKETLTSMNKAWRIHRCETPPLIPIEHISEAYDASDLFITNHSFDRRPLALRAETTHGSYTFLRDLFPNNLNPKEMNKQLPICVWQVGYSFRTENSDGATAAKLRFNAFKQLEFQCVYSDSTMADYRGALIKALSTEIKRFTGAEVRVVDSDRLPSYSESTLDIECFYTKTGEWKEVASCSIRTDFSEDTRVTEIAIGLDRIIEIAQVLDK